MADIDENLVTVLKSDSGVSAITTSVHVNRVPESKTQPYIWLQLDDDFEPLMLVGSSELQTVVFDIECTSTDLDESKDLQAAVKTALHGIAGSFGDQTIAFSDVTSKDDSYQSRQVFGDSENFHVSALSLEIGVDGR